MTTINIRRQGGAAIMTIPADVMKSLGVAVGAQLEVSVVDGALTARPHATPRRRRYRLQDLLVGATPDAMRDLAEKTAWARDGAPVGREI